jgi:hypothetical protein
MKNHNLQESLKIFQTLGKFCTQHLNTDLYPSLFTDFHARNLDMCDYNLAQFVEDLYWKFLQSRHAGFHSSFLCMGWQNMNNRLIKTGNYIEAYKSVNKLMNYSQKHALVHVTLQNQISFSQIHLVFIFQIVNAFRESEIIFLQCLTS